MKYEHKTVGLNWFDAANRQEGMYQHTTQPNLGTDDGWHVVGVIAPSGESSSFTQTYFLMERMIPDA